MSLRWFVGLSVPALGVVLTTGLVVRSGTLDSKLQSWTPKPHQIRTSQTGAPALPVVSRLMAEGRVVAYPGAEVVVGTEAAGRIVRVDVQEKSIVRKGELLAELNADDLKASQAEADARMAAADADIRYYERELKRDESLVARRAGTAQNVDANRRELESARARRAGAAADRDRFAALVAQTRIVAPIDGVVTERHAHPGETVSVAARIVTIADLNRVRIEAELDEFDTGRVVLGAEVTITAEGFPAASWAGIVEEIPDSVVPRRIRPEDPGRPIDARVLPVKVAFRASTPLKLGQRVEVQIGVPAVTRHASSE